MKAADPNVQRVELIAAPFPDLTHQGRKSCGLKCLHFV